jgi:hypothetical protein
MNLKKYIYRTDDGDWAVAQPDLKNWYLFKDKEDAWMWAKRVVEYQLAYDGYDDEDPKPEPPKPPTDIEIAKVISRRVLDELAAKLKARNRR